MWFFKKKSEHCKLDLHTKSLLEYAKKVINYRRHIIGNAVCDEIKQRMHAIEVSLSKNDIDGLRASSAQLNTVLEKNGGDIFPVRFLNDNLEVLFVASLIAVSLRTFFIQSFQIPTNSMFPTYYGMTHEIIDKPRSLVGRIFNKIRFFGTDIDVISKNDGMINVPVVAAISSADGKISYIAKYDVVAVKKLFGMRAANVRRYNIFVGDEKHTFDVPIEFSADKVLLEKFFHGKKSFNDVIGPQLDAEKRPIMLLPTNCRVTRGSSVLHFQILQGDMLFVDKISPHFRTPKPGDSVVFTAENIEKMSDKNKYFIKRAAGRSGDEVGIRDGQLMVNGSQFLGNDIVQKINAQRGYVPFGSLSDNMTVTVPPKQFFVLGDNSSNSNDSRFWGGVPEKNICGYPLFIFYPFSERFGMCK